MRGAHRPGAEYGRSRGLTAYGRVGGKAAHFTLVKVGMAARLVQVVMSIVLRSCWACRQSNGQSGNRPRRRSGGNIGQSDHFIANSVAGHEVKRWWRTGEEGLAVTKDDGMDVEPIFVDKTKIG